MFSSVSAIGETRDWSRIRFGGGAQGYRVGDRVGNRVGDRDGNRDGDRVGDHVGNRVGRSWRVAILGEISSSYKSKGDRFGSRPSGTQTKQEDGENGIVLAATRDH